VVVPVAVVAAAEAAGNRSATHGEKARTIPGLLVFGLRQCKEPYMQQDKPTPVLGETIADYRARIAQHQAEIIGRRQQELLEQASTMYAPSVRIRIWERLHQVGLPHNPAHRLLDVIAANTGLSIEEVREEQRQRQAPPVEPVS
jgi:hypothetical protein